MITVRRTQTSAALDNLLTKEVLNHQQSSVRDPACSFLQAGHSLAIVTFKVPEGGWIPPTGCPDRRENDFPLFLLFTRCCAGPSRPATQLANQLGIQRFPTPPVGVKGRCRPLLLAVKTGLALSPLSEVLWSNTEALRDYLSLLQEVKTLLSRTRTS